MKNLSKRIFALLILFVSVLIFSMLTVTASTVSEQQTYTNDGSVQIEEKYKKVSTNKVTFNANGGKIGSKKVVSTNIKKGAKIKNFPTTPKRTGYSFKGWYTKKTGGKKISVETKPTKNVILYAKWTKKSSSRILTAEEKKFVGVWVNHYIGIGNVRKTYTCEFTNKGTFIYLIAENNVKTGNYKVSGGKVTLTNIKWTYGDDGKKEYYPDKQVVGYKFETQFAESGTKVEYLKMAQIDYPQFSYLDYNSYHVNWNKFYKDSYYKSWSSKHSIYEWTIFK